MDKKLEDSASDIREQQPGDQSALTIGNLAKLLVSAGIIAASVAGFYWLGEAEAPSRNPPPKPPGVAVTSIPVIVHEGAVAIDTNGVVVPYREIAIAPEVSGRVVEQSPNLRAGRRVKKGETLIRIDPADYEIEVRRLKSLEKQAQAELDALAVNIENTNQVLVLSKEELELQQAEMRRIENLRSRNASSTSETEAAKRAELIARAAVVRVENELRNAAANKELLQQKLDLTRVELERAILDRARTKVVSPVDGTIAQSMVEEQSYVAAGQTFTRIEDASAMEVRCNLTMDEMHWVWNHQPSTKSGHRSAQDANPSLSPIEATVRCEIGSHEYQWQATFERVDGTGIDDDTRTVPCLFRVDRPDDSVRVIEENQHATPENVPGNGAHSLIRGMFVSVRMQTDPNRQLFRVPNESIRPGKRVWLAENEKLKVVDVKIVSRIGPLTVIESAEVYPGAKVITSPVPGAREGLQLMAGGGKPGGRRPGANGPGGRGPGAKGAGAKGPPDKAPGAKGRGGNGPAVMGPNATGPGAMAPSSMGPPGSSSGAMMGRATAPVSEKNDRPKGDAGQQSRPRSDTSSFFKPRIRYALRRSEA